MYLTVFLLLLLAAIILVAIYSGAFSVTLFNWRKISKFIRRYPGRLFLIAAVTVVLFFGNAFIKKTSVYLEKRSAAKEASLSQQLKAEKEKRKRLERALAFSYYRKDPEPESKTGRVLIIDPANDIDISPCRAVFTISPPLKKGNEVIFEEGAELDNSACLFLGKRNVWQGNIEKGKKFVVPAEGKDILIAGNEPLNLARIKIRILD